MDPLAFARTDDPVELEYLQLVAERAIDIYNKSRIDLANRIAQNMGKLFGARTRDNA